MENKKDKQITRRQFIRDSAITVAGLAVGLSAASCQRAYTSPALQKTRSYNPQMEYRRLGKTNIYVSVVCLGGHWKRLDRIIPGLFRQGSWLNVDLNNPSFKKNRYDVVTRCIESGINYIDACTSEEVIAYADALRARRDKMYLGFSWYQQEMRFPPFRTTKALLQTLDKGLHTAKLDYVDLWRITMLEQSGRHTKAEVDQMMAALEKAKKQGKCRFTGLSSHDRPHIKWMIQSYPNIVQVIVTPYTAKSKVLPRDSLFEAIKKYDVGFFGIKPFANNSLFKGDSSPHNPYAQEDDRRARMAIRYILCNPAITAPIPGLINTHQVDNVVEAIRERRQLDLTEAKELEEAMDQAWAKLPADYQWLKEWEYV